MRQTFHIDFIKKSKIFFCISLSIMLVCLVLNLSIFHTKVDIQFTGGTIIKYSYTGDASQDEIKKAIEETLKDTENFKGQTPEFSFSSNLVTSENDKNDKIVTVTFSGTKITSKESASEASRETSAETSAQTSAETSAQTSAETSAQTSAEASAQTSAETSAQTSAETSAQTSAEASAQTSAEASAQTSAETSAQTSTQTSAVVEVSENSETPPADPEEVSQGSVTKSTAVDETSNGIKLPDDATDEEVPTVGALDDDDPDVVDDTDGEESAQVTEETSEVEEKIKTVGSNEDIRKITNALQTKFPEANFTEVSSTSVDPSKGTNFFLKCLTAVILAAVLMIFYVALRFRKIGGLSAGVMAVAALVHDLIIVYFVFVIFRMPLNDNFIAVVLMILGYSLNDTIVIYDRIRENRRKSGPRANIGDVVNTSLNQCMIRTICTSITTIIAIGSVLVVSLMYNIDSIVSFALPMMIGLISGSYSSLCIAAPLWVMWKNHQAKKKLQAKESGTKAAKKKSK